WAHAFVGLLPGVVPRRLAALGSGLRWSRCKQEWWCAGCEVAARGGADERRVGWRWDVEQEGVAIDALQVGLRTDRHVGAVGGSWRHAEPRTIALQIAR